MLRKFLKYCVSFLAVLAITSVPAVSAQPNLFVPYTTYDYNQYSESIPAPVGYTVVEKITGESLGLDKSFETPTDLFFDDKDTLYVLDSGNSRIVILDTHFQFKGVMQEFQDENGEIFDFSGANVFTVAHDGTVYIADTERERILVFNGDGSFRQMITKPEQTDQSSELPFDVSKLLIDENNYLYAIAKSCNLGAFVFNENGEFEKYFGSNPVVKTSEVVMNYFLRRFLTQEQLDGLVKSTPITISNFDIDDNGFIYSATISSGSSTIGAGMIRKLNYLDKDTLTSGIIFGDLEWDRKSVDSTVITTFGDIDVDNRGFLNLLDTGRAKVFQYTQDGQLISVFGSYGDQNGCFGQPTAIVSSGDKVYVADSGKNCIHVFAPTAYATQYRNAILKLQKNEFESSLNEFEELLSLNTNNEQAYYGMGLVYDVQGNYKEAMRCFKLANHTEGYSEAFREYRRIALKNLTIPLIIFVVAVLGVLKLLAVKKAKVVTTTSNGYSKWETKYAFPLYTLFHPLDGFYQVKTRKIGSLKVAFILIVAVFAVTTFSFFSTGYLFNTNRISDYNIFIMLLQTVGLLVLFIVANWSVCTLLNGNGSLKEITIVTAYAMVPWLGCTVLKVVLSNFLVLQEYAFLDILVTVGLLWSILLLICGMYCIHEYTVFQTVFAIIMTLLGMAIIVFLIAMFFSLLQQTGSFFDSIITEAIFKWGRG